MRAERNFETFRGYRRSCEMGVEHDFYKYCKERYGRKEGRKEGKEGGKTALAHPAPAMELSGAIFQF